LVALNVFQRGSNLIIQNMSIAGRGCSRGSAPFVDELEIAGLAQKLSREIMAEIVKPEIDNSGSLASPPPHCLGSFLGDRIALTLHQPLALVGALTNVCVYPFRVMRHKSATFSFATATGLPQSLR
jgi:hypothetical protein